MSNLTLLLLLTSMVLVKSLDATLDVTPLTIREKAEYYFSIKLQSNLLEKAQIAITFPEPFQSLNSDLTISEITGVINPTSLRYSISGLTLTITDCFPSTDARLITLTIHNLTNPSIAKQSSSFIIKILDMVNGSLVTTDVKTTGVTKTYTAATIKSAAISLRNKIAAAKSEWELKLETKYAVPIGGLIEMIMPVWNSYTNSESYCQTTVTCFNIESDASLTQQTCSCSSLKLTVTLGKELTGVMNVLVKDITNPPSTKEVTGFQISTRFNSGDIEKSSTLSIRSESPGNLSISTIEIDNTQINKSGIYKFYLTTTPPIPASSTLTLILPSDISIDLTRSRSVTGNFNMIRSPTYTLTDSTYIISSAFSSNLTSESMIIFSVSYLINPSSTKPSGGIYIKIDSKEGVYICETKILGSVTASYGSISSINILPDDSTISSTTIYTFSFVPLDSIPAAGSIKITVPSAVTLTNTSGDTRCYLIISGLNPNARCSIQDNRYIYITQAFTSTYSQTTLSLKINSIQNPAVSGTSSNFNISSYTDSSFKYLIGQGITSVSFSCTSPCISCTVVASRCTSCDSNSSFPYLWNNNCNARCDVGWYDPNNTKYCAQCDAKCKTCEEKADKCMTCDNSGSYEYLYANNCIHQCPGNTYTSSDFRCINCDSTCITCQGTSSYCTSCSELKKLYKGSCLDLCPVGTIEQSGLCTDCISSCKECMTSASLCTACPDSLVLYNSSCLSSCPKETTVTSNGQCIPCSNLCASCAGSISQCTSCYDGFFLYNESCVSVCPSGYGRINKFCTKCTGECLECTGTAEFCIKCPELKYRLDGICVSNCPSGETVLIGDECIRCVEYCKACQYFPDMCVMCQDGKVLYQGACIDYCPSGFVGREGVCVKCQGCKECVDSISNCIECYDGYWLYGNMCVSECPVDFTIEVGNLCLACERPCMTCEGVVSRCKSCYSGYGLYENSCLAECPSGYKILDSKCTPITIQECAPGCTLEMQFDSFCQSECNLKACNFDNTSCESPSPPDSPITSSESSKTYSDSLRIEDYPLPATFSSALLGISLGMLKLLTGNIILSSSLVSLWSFQEVSNWSLLAYYLSKSDDTSERLLVESEDSEVYLCFVLVLVLICVNVVVNCSFLGVYYKWIYMRDINHKKWVSVHRGMYTLYALMTVVSYKLIWILESNILCRKTVGAKFTKRKMIYKLLNWYTLLYLIVIGIPGAALNVYILSSFSSGNDVFMISVDSLIHFSMEICVIVYQIIYINQVIGREQAIDEFTSYSVIFPPRFEEETDRSKVHHSATVSISRDLSDDRKSIDMTFTAHKTIEDDFLIEDFQGIKTESSAFLKQEPESEFSSPTRMPIEDKQIRTIDQNDLSISFQITENSPQSKSELEEHSKDMDQFSFMIDEPLPKPSSPKLFDTILNENQLNLAESKLYDFDPECLEVLHKQSNKRIIIKKSFWDGTVVDASNRPILSYTPIVPHLYSIKEIDKSDPHYATLKHKNTHQKIRVRRSFDKCRVMDIENLSQGGWVVGKIVINEEDFDFNHAEIDVKDIETVYVRHIKNGCKMKIKKTFIGCPEIHPKTGEVITGKEITEYNSQDVEIDSQDVHFATVYLEGHPIRVYRSFLGAKILDVLQEEMSSTNSLEVTAQFCPDHTASFGNEISTSTQKEAESKQMFQKIDRKLPQEKEGKLQIRAKNFLQSAKHESSSVEEVSAPIHRGSTALKSLKSSKNISFKQKPSDLIDPMRMRKLSSSKPSVNKRRFFSPFENPQSSTEKSGSMAEGEMNILNMRRDPEHLELEMLRRGNMS